jgi:hypothetical protein
VRWRLPEDCGRDRRSRRIGFRALLVVATGAVILCLGTVPAFASPGRAVPIEIPDERPVHEPPRVSHPSDAQQTWSDQLPPREAATLFGASETIGSADGYRWRGTIFIPRHSATNALSWYLGRPLQQTTLFLNLVHLDTEDHGQVDAEIAGRSIDAAVMDDGRIGLTGYPPAGGPGGPRHTPTRFVVVIGHNDNGVIVQRRSDGTFVSYPMREFQAIEAVYGVQFLFFACGAGHDDVAGPSEDVFTSELSGRLKQLQSAGTFGDVFAAFGTKANPLMLNDVNASMTREALLSIEIHGTSANGDEVSVKFTGMPPASPPPVTDTEATPTEEGSHVTAFDAFVKFGSVFLVAVLIFVVLPGVVVGGLIWLFTGNNAGTTAEKAVSLSPEQQRILEVVEQDAAAGEELAKVLAAVREGKLSEAAAYEEMERIIARSKAAARSRPGRG